MSKSPSFSTIGTFRVSFNRHGAAPLVCSIATDDWEINVRGFQAIGVEMRSVYVAKATPDDEDGKPSFWIEVTGLLDVADGVARFRPTTFHAEGGKGCPIDSHAADCDCMGESGDR